MNYSSNYLTPSCEILVNGQKRKLYGKNKNKVYLNDGDEFQLQVYNPFSNRIGFQLKMNGGDSDNGILIISPGQSVIIERFIGTNRKLKFSTYLVDKNNPQTKKAIKENGQLEIVFWEEYKNPNYGTITIQNPNPIWVTPTPGTTPYNPPTWPYTYCGNDLNIGSANNVSMGSTAGWANSNSFTNLNSDKCTYTSGIVMDGDVSINGNLSVNGQIVGSPNPNLKSKLSRGLSETGRIEKGNKSNQHFLQTDFICGRELITYRFKLLPFSEKEEDRYSAPYQSGPFQLQNNPYVIPNANFNNTSYVKSEGREYCPNKRCNYRVRKNNWGYCPLCGTPLN